MTELELPYDAFLRAVKQSTDIDHVFLLGAGASISSNIQSAADCIWEWKRDIFVSKNLNLANQYKEYKSDAVKDSIQKWLDNEGSYLPKNHADEYSTYAQLAYPIEDIRRKYFENLCRNKDPYIGYKILCLLAKSGLVKAVFTTNFDGLTVKASHQLGITPIEIALDSSERIYRPSTNNELLCIALHGDYKYGPLKNTNAELDSQHADFVKALIHHLNDKHLIVIGYSGRDKSLMSALNEAYQSRGSGILYWCGYGTEIGDDVRNLLNTVRSNNRQAYYVATDGFDNTLIHLAKNGYSDSAEFQTLLANTLTANNNEGWIKTPFTMDIKHTNAVIRSNLFPFTLPKEIFQFEFLYKNQEQPWDTIKQLTKETEVVAGPIKDMVYALGTLSDIREVFKGRIKGDVRRTPVTNDDFRDGSTMKSLMLRAIIQGICSKFGLNNDGHNKIWNPTDKISVTAASVSYEIFEAAKISLFFDQNSKFAYLSIKPTYWMEEDKDLPFTTRLEIGRAYSNKLLNSTLKPNFNFNLFLDKWKKILFQSGKLAFDYPVDSASGFKFAISYESMHVRVMKAGSSKGINLPQTLNQRTILHGGIQYLEPQLQFISKGDNRIVYDFHPMRGLIENHPYDYPLNGNVFEAAINVSIICPPEFGYKVADFLNRLHLSQSAGTHNQAYLIDYPGFSQAYGIPLNIPTFQSGLWQRITLAKDTGVDLIKRGLEILSVIKEKIDILEQANGKKVIVIFIPDAWSQFTKIESEHEKFDLHNHIKAYAAQKGLATQFLREDTLTDPLRCQVNWWLSLSLYVKSLRTPWILSGLDSQTAFVGIGYSINHRSRNEKIVLGCSHIYSASGQGLRYKLSRVEDCVYDRKNNPFLSYQDSYKFGVSIREMFLGAMGELPKRVVVHKRTPFRKDEVKGIVDSLKKSGITEVDLIEINFEEDGRFLALSLRNNEVNADNYPLSRGTCFLLDDQTALLWTHGIVPSVKSYGNYYLGAKNIPIPLKIKKHYGSSNISAIATEILGLTKVNWNSFDLYSKLPATIQTSNEIAKIGWLLNRFEGRTYDYRNFM